MRRALICLGLCACRYDFEKRPARDASTDLAILVDTAIDAPLTCIERAQPIATDGTIGGTLAASSATDEAGSCGGAGIAELVYSIDLPVSGAGLVVGSDGNGATMDTLLYIRSQCANTASELVCDLDSGISAAGAYRLTNLPAGRYFVFVDGQAGATGDFTGTAQVLLPQGATCDAASVRDRCGPELACSGVCLAAGCAVAETLSGANSYQRTVLTTGSTNLHAGSCGTGNDGGVRAPERIYGLTLASAVTNVHVSTASAATDYDTLIYVRTACNGSEIACNDDNGMPNNQSDLDTGALAAGTYLIFIDGFATRSGTADVTVTVTP